MRKMQSRGDELYSDDVFWVLFDYEVTRSQRYPSPLSLVQIEMKPSTGDPVIMRAAASIFCSALNSHLRSSDIPTGSDSNYFVLLPTTEEKGCRALCERLISIFRNRYESKEGQSITFSLNIGMASHTGGSAMTKEDLLQGAEKAIKQSKLKGPNTYVASSDL
jgi:GGDEF domain-containing protein